MIDKEQERKRIGERIKEIRQNQGMTQEELGTRTGIQRNHITRIEKGRYSVGFDTLENIAEVLGKKIDFI